MSIRELTLMKSDLDSEPDLSMDFESSDYFLQIHSKDIHEIPKGHFIKPFIPSGALSIGEIHFLPNGDATENSSNRTEILHIGIRAIEEYLNKLKTNASINYDFIYGRSDPHMARVARQVGFITIEDKNNLGSFILYTTPKDIIKSFEKLKKDGVIDKIKKRRENLQNCIQK